MSTLGWPSGAESPQWKSIRDRQNVAYLASCFINGDRDNVTICTPSLSDLVTYKPAILATGGLSEVDIYNIQADVVARTFMLPNMDAVTTMQADRRKLVIGTWSGHILVFDLRSTDSLALPVGEYNTNTPGIGAIKYDKDHLLVGKPPHTLASCNTFFRSG